MSREKYKCVMTTVAGDAQAVAMAEAIVRGRLAACVQFWPIRSVYWWKGKVESGHELILLCKTRASLVRPLQQYIRIHHLYEIPEIVVIPIETGFPSYLAWIMAETSEPPLTFSPSATRKRGSRSDGKS